MEISLVIRNATIVDGLGAKGWTGDVAVAGDRIAAVSPKIDCDAPSIDAGGKILTPGFIEIHTHYDPQLCWDRMATPVLEHGTTTIVFGNCSLSLAPVRKGEAERLTKMYSKIEDLEADIFDRAVPYSWQTFEEYLAYLRPGLGLNAGAMVGHTALRHYVMGTAAQKRIATDAELDRMCGVLAESLQAGAFGLSLSYADRDADNLPVASCLADTREREALARTVVENGRHLVQSVRDITDIEARASHLQEQAQISQRTGALCAVTPFMDLASLPDEWRRELAKLEEIERRGGNVIGQVSPRPVDLNFRLSRSQFSISRLPSWAPIMAMPVADRIRAFADRSQRAQLAAEMEERRVAFQTVFVRDVASASNRRYVGRLLPEIAEDESKSIADVLLDIALEDDLETDFATDNSASVNLDNVATMLRHPRLQIGASDGGAHVAQFATTGDCTYLLQQFVRAHPYLTLEHAVKRITSEIAEQTGIKDRGTIAPGKFADLVLLDLDTVARGDLEMIYDLPGEKPRYVRRPTGIELVIVNGKIVRQHGAYTDERAGMLV